MSAFFTKIGFAVSLGAIAPTDRLRLARLADYTENTPKSKFIAHMRPLVPTCGQMMNSVLDFIGITVTVSENYAGVSSAAVRTSATRVSSAFLGEAPHGPSVSPKVMPYELRQEFGP